MHFMTVSLQLVPRTKRAVLVFYTAFGSRSSRAFFPF